MPATWSASEGDATPIQWVHRTDRFAEKLATPDTSIADLIGEVDPIKVAEGRYLSDELTLHYGLVPRTNRGIFAINELPDLAERIQVGLLNVLEERDVQIRGFTVRLPLDVMLVATANPEDYTNRGRIITPLKDRFGAQIRTHYPPDTETELAIVRPGGPPPAVDGGPRRVPTFMAEVVAELSQLARQSPHVNQRSGVSVRLSISNYETLVANAVRRALRLRRARGRAPGERPGCPRRLHPGQDRDRGPGGGSRRPDPRSASSRPPSLTVFRRRCPDRAARVGGGAFDDARVDPRRRRPPAAAYAEVLAAAARPRSAGAGPGRRRDARRHGQRHRVRPRGPASDQAAQQGGGRRSGHLSGPDDGDERRAAGHYRRWDGTQAASHRRDRRLSSPTWPTTCSTTATPMPPCGAC